MIEVRANGKKYSDWTEAEVSKDIDNASGSGSFKTSRKIPDLYAGDKIQILVDKEARLTGYIDVVDDSNDENDISQSFTVRDIVADLVDSSLPDEAKKFKSGTTPSNIVETVLKALKIDCDVINDAGGIKPFSRQEKVVAESGANAFEFITNYLRKRSLFLNSDGNGNVILYKLTNLISAEFNFENKLNGNTNIISSSKTVDYSERFRYYVCKSQSSDGSSVNRIGKAEDTEIRSSRYYEFESEETMSSKECKTRAEEEANIRRARSTNYSVSFPAHSQNGKVFDIAKGARVNDEGVGIAGVLLIKSVKFTESEQEEKTEISLTYPDAYSVEANLKQKEQKRIDFKKKPKSAGLL